MTAPWEPPGRQAFDDALRTINVLFEPTDVIEIRARAVNRNPGHCGITYSGYFNFENHYAIARAIKQLDGRAEGVHVVLNRYISDSHGSHRGEMEPQAPLARAIWFDIAHAVSIDVDLGGSRSGNAIDGH